MCLCRVSGCVDYFAALEEEAYEYTRNIISTLNFELPEEEDLIAEEPLHPLEELKGLAPRDYNHSLDVRLVSTILPMEPLLIPQHYSLTTYRH